MKIHYQLTPLSDEYNLYLWGFCWGALSSLCKCWSLIQSRITFFIIIIILLFSICTQWSHKDVILSLLLTGFKVHWIVLFAPINGMSLSWILNAMECKRLLVWIQGVQGLKLTLILWSDFLLLLSKSWSKGDRHRSYFLSLKADIWLDWVARLCS